MWISLYFMNTNQWTFHHNHISSICIAIHFLVKFHEYTLTYNFFVIRNAPCNYATMHSLVNPWQEKMTQKNLKIFCTYRACFCFVVPAFLHVILLPVPLQRPQVWSAYPLLTWGVTRVHEQVPIATCAQGLGLGFRV
jgi:hypothetical protein